MQVVEKEISYKMANEIKWFGKILSPRSRRANRIRKRNLIPSTKRIQKELFREWNIIGVTYMTLYQERRGLQRLRDRLCLICGAPLIDEEAKRCFACRSFQNYPIIKGVLRYETSN